ncbi:MAG: hypothetical protein ACP5G6_05625 [Conexivisphaera sp.]|jgi:hypothetical protein|nr:hypothetical protein [Conexivisphaerales archaeon]
MARRVAFYGLSSELRRLPSRILGSLDLYFIDEVLCAAYTAADVKHAPQPDSLTPMISLEQALSSSSEVVFAPRYKSIEDPDARIQEIRSHLEILLPFLKGKTVINALPVGYGENSQMEEFIATRIGSAPEYVYAPIEPGGSIRYIGVREGNSPKWLLEATKGEVMGIEEAEAAHIDDALSSMMPALIRGVVAQGPPVGYLRDAFSGALESFLVGANADPGSSAYSVYTLVRRSFDEYMRRLTSSLKEAIRESGMKISRARIAVLWTPDEDSARGDELWVFEKVRELLTSTFVDVTFVRSDRLLQLDRKDVVLVGTKADEEALSRRKFEGRLIVRALYPRPEIERMH